MRKAIQINSADINMPVQKKSLTNATSAAKAHHKGPQDCACVQQLSHRYARGISEEVGYGDEGRIGDEGRLRDEGCLSHEGRFGEDPKLVSLTRAVQKGGLLSGLPLDLARLNLPDVRLHQVHDDIGTALKRAAPIAE